MSDVPGAAFWTLALAMAVGREWRTTVLAGVFAAVAILIRPNLLPLGMVLGVYLLLQPDRSWRERLANGAVYAAPCAIGCLAVAFVQWHFYGSPLSSGYGAPGVIVISMPVSPNTPRHRSSLV